MDLLILATALVTPLPPQRSLTSSRSSQASCSPVLAPLGTAAVPTAPPASRTSASTVGLPRESMIWRARMAEMAVSDIRKKWSALTTEPSATGQPRFSLGAGVDQKYSRDRVDVPTLLR
jgi:hypothetical protein